MTDQSTSTGPNELERLRDILYGDQSRSTQAKLDKLESHFDALYKELLQKVEENFGLITGRLEKISADQAASMENQRKHLAAEDLRLFKQIEALTGDTQAQLALTRQELDQRNEKLQAQFEAAHQELDQRNEKLQAQFEAAHQELKHSDDQISADLTSRLATILQELTQRMDQQDNQLNEQIQVSLNHLNAHLESKAAALQAEIERNHSAHISGLEELTSEVQRSDAELLQQLLNSNAELKQQLISIASALEDKKVSRQDLSQALIDLGKSLRQESITK